MKYKAGDFIICWNETTADLCDIAYIENYKEYAHTYNIVVVDSSEGFLNAWDVTMQADRIDNSKSIALLPAITITPVKNVCSCPIMALMNLGCKCGGA